MRAANFTHKSTFTSLQGHLRGRFSKIKGKESKNSNRNMHFARAQNRPCKLIGVGLGEGQGGARVLLKGTV